MQKFSAAALILALALPFGAQAQTAPIAAAETPATSAQTVGKERIAVYGHGNSQCADYLDFQARGQDAVVRNYQVWVNGFVSAYNTLLSTTGNVAKDKRSDDLMGWLQTYCRSNPDALFQRATIELLRSLEAGEF